jgi:hypothetical protein
MTIRPVDPYRVSADELHVGDENVGRNGVEIKSPNTGPLIHTTGTAALPAKVAVSVDPDVAFFPGNLQRPLLCESPKILRWMVHNFDPFAHSTE